MSPAFVPAPSLPLAREEWPDTDFDFDLPEDQTLLDQVAESDAEGDDGPRSRRQVIEPEEDEDWDADFDLGNLSKGVNLRTDRLPGAGAAHNLNLDAKVESVVGAVGTITRLGGPAKHPRLVPLPPDNDDEFGPSTSRLHPAKQTMTISKPINPVAQADDDDDGNASTIKVSRLPPIPQANKPRTPVRNTVSLPARAAIFAEDEDFEESFLLPTSLANLSLRPATLRLPKTSLPLEWSSDGTTVSDSPSSLGISGRLNSLGLPLPTASPSTSTASTTSTSQPDLTEFSDDSDGENDADSDSLHSLLSGVILPTTVSSSSLNQILNAKKQGKSGMGGNIMDLRHGGSVKVASPDDDFEIGLVIGDDDILSPTRLKGVLAATISGKPSPKAGSTDTIRSKTQSLPPPPRPPSSGARPPSRLRPEKSRIGIGSSPDRSPPSKSSETRTKSPSASDTLSSQRPSLKRKPTASFHSLRQLSIPSASSSTDISKTTKSVTRPPSAQSSKSYTRSASADPPSSPPPSAPANVSRIQSMIPTLSHAHSMLSIPRTSPTVVKHQKSHPKLMESPTITKGSEMTSHRTLIRKASLSSLVDAAAGVVGTSSHASSSKSSKDVGTANGARYNAPTASSRARQLRTTDGVVGSERDKESFLRPTLIQGVPPARPSTPSSNPAALRLTMPTSSSRARMRAPITNIFPTSSNPTSTSTEPRSGRSSVTSPLGKKSAIPSSIPIPTPNVRILRRPKKARTYGDGTELDGIEDLVVEREKERKYIRPVAGYASGGRTQKLSPGKSTSSSGTIGRRSGLNPGATSIPTPTPTTGVKRPGSSTSNHSNTEVPKFPPPPPKFRSRTDYPSDNSTSPSLRRKKTATREGLRAGPRKKPTLIRNLGGAGSPKVVGEMRWNPITLKWEGNNSVLRDFEAHVHSSTRPALITHLTGSSVGGLGSPTGFLAGGARVVGNMIFDPAKMCWISRYPAEEADVFAGMDDDDDDNEATWGRGGTIRQGIGAGFGGSKLQSVQGSPSRSLHIRSTSESESESVTGTGTGPSRAGSLSPVPGPLPSLAEQAGRASPLLLGPEGEIVEVDDALRRASRAAEERHRFEMKGWSIPASRRTGSRGSRSSSEPEREEDVDRSYLYEIRALATRQY